MADELPEKIEALLRLLASSHGGPDVRWANERDIRRIARLAIEESTRSLREKLENAEEGYARRHKDATDLWEQINFPGGMNEQIADLRAKLEAAERYRWLPIETAPKNNECPLLLARFNDDGSLQSIDHDGTWTSERESWELPNVYYFWASANGYVEEPSHWMYQPSWYAAIEKERSRDC